MVSELNASPTSDYLSLLISMPHVTPLGLMTFFFLGLMRIGPIVSLVPFLGARLPGSVKVGLALTLTFILLPQIIHSVSHTMTFDMQYIGYSLKELFVGITLAFLAAIPFYIAESSGSLIDFMRGSSSLQVTEPFMQTQTSTIGNLFNYMTVIVFFQIGGLFFFLEALAYSFQMLPIDQLLKLSFFNLSMPFWKLIVGLLTRVTAVSMQLAAPSIVSILMAEMFLGIANRLAPQVQIVFLGMSLKSLLGLGLLFAGWIFILQQVGNQCLLWLHDLEKVLQSFGF
jgi:type III secretion protein T